MLSNLLIYIQKTLREPSQHDKKITCDRLSSLQRCSFKLDLGEITPISLMLELFASKKITRLESTSEWLSRILFYTPGIRQCSKYFQQSWSSWPFEPNIASCCAWNEKTAVLQNTIESQFLYASQHHDCLPRAGINYTSENVHIYFPFHEAMRIVSEASYCNTLQWLHH